MSARIALFGAEGQVGRALTVLFNKNSFEVELLGRAYDICDPNTWRARLEGFKPDIIINAAAFTAVDACEVDSARAFEVNRDAVGQLAMWSSQAGAALIHLSTDYVFGNAGVAPLSERDLVAPLNIYGQSKAEGEAILRATLKRHVIIRTSWIYGPDAGNFFATMMRLGGEKEVLSIVEDEASCPTFAPDLADAVVKVCQQIFEGQGVWGTFHVAGRDGLTRLEFAQKIMDARAALGLKVARLVPITQAAYGAPAVRPFDSRLSCDAVEQAYKVRLPGLSERLPALLAELTRAELLG